MRGPLWLAIMGLLALIPAGTARAASPVAGTKEHVSKLAETAGFKGWLLIADQRDIWVAQGIGDVGDAAPGRPFKADDRWPWASETKQVVATMVMQQVAAGQIALDNSAADYLPALYLPAPGASMAAPTVRQLLQHQSGLCNPDDSPVDPRGTPSFYWNGPTGLPWCLAERGAAGGNWRYNNCDYIVLGALLEKVTGKTFTELFARHIARPARLRTTALMMGEAMQDMIPAAAVYQQALPRYGTAGALAGTPGDLLAFDRALLAGKLLPNPARATMWAGDPALGYMALGQWAFAAPVTGCAKPVRIIERRGGIGDFQLRNLILPDLGLFVIAFTNRSDFDFGEIWTGKGFSHALLQKIACGEQHQ